MARVAGRMGRGGVVLAVAGFAACGGGMSTVEPGAGCAGLSDGDVALRLGETCVLDGPTASNFRLAASEGAQEYVVVVQSASRIAGSTNPIRLHVRGSAAGGEASVSASIAGPGAARDAVRDARLETAEQASLMELRLRDNAIAELRRVGARGMRLPPGFDSGAGLARAVSAVQMTVGDTLTVKNSVRSDLSVDCTSTETITTVVRAVSEHFVLVEDTTVAGHFTEADFNNLAEEYDQHVYPVNMAYFGEPVDLDANGLVVLVFTAVVNRLATRGSGTFVAGYFNPVDISDNCSAGNHGEFLYLLAPDPAGEYSDPKAVDFVLNNSKGVVAHELQHLIEAEQRIVVNGGSLFFDLEDSWLSEGLAHIAETAVGLSRAGLGTRQNLGFAALAADFETFEAYHLTDFNRLGHNFKDPDGTLALGGTFGSDPPGISSLEMRGFAWNFLRWVADQYAPASPEGPVPGSGEDRLFRELTVGGPELATGPDNILRALQVVSGHSTTWDRLIAGYGYAPVLDDAGPAALPATTQVRTWNLRDIYSGLHDMFPDKTPFTKEYPLVVTQVVLSESTNQIADFSLAAGAAHYAELVSSSPHSEIDVEVSLQGGGGLPEGVQVLLARLR